MEHPFTISHFRAELGMTLESFGKLIGLASKGNVSLLERGKATPTVAVALRLEELSKGRLDAGALNSDVAAARRRPACIDDDSPAGSYATELAHTHTKRVEDYAPAAPDPVRVVLCDACEVDVQGPEAAACTYIDCPCAVIVDHAA